MRLQSLSVEGFRNYGKLDVDFAEGNIHLLLGANGAGKTNILEAVSVLSLSKSCLGAEEEDLVRWGGEYYRISARGKSDQGILKEFEVVSEFAPRRAKACFLNDVHVSVAEFVGALPAVAFLPQDLELFTGSPAVRRAFLDELLCQVSSEYLVASSQYSKILKQRGSLLRKIRDGISSPSDLEPWDARLAEAGSLLTLMRLELLQVFQCALSEELGSLGERWPDAEIIYERKTSARVEKELEHELRELLLHYQERDLALVSTTVGPHRDDFRVEVSGRSLPTFASRGQQRTAVLALLFLEVSYLELRKGEKPVILLDDVFSELDDAHQTALLASLSEHQVIVTATHTPPLLTSSTVWEVGSGVLAKADLTRSASSDAGKRRTPQEQARPRHRRGGART